MHFKLPWFDFVLARVDEKPQTCSTCPPVPIPWLSTNIVISHKYAFIVDTNFAISELIMIIMIMMRNLMRKVVARV